METMTIPEFHAALRAQGVSSHEHCAFLCPMCNTAQSGASLIAAGAGKTFDDVERYVGFSCVGRFTGAGSHDPKSLPGRGCDWTLGGLLRLHQLVVIDDEGKERPRFRLASPDQAQALERENAARERDLQKAQSEVPK